MDELRECPHCGGKNVCVDVFEGHIDCYRYECKDCGFAPDYWTDTEIEALKYWNTRPLESALRARVAELEIIASTAHRLIDDATDLMTPEQVGRWHGVRTWLETLES